MPLLSPQEAVSRQQWLCLVDAATAAENGHIISALDAYRQVVPNLLHEGTLRWANINPDQSVLSRNGMCRLLIPYYTLTQTWQAWRFVAQPILDEAIIHTLSPSERSILISAYGWATVRHRPLERIIDDQQTGLESCRSSGGMLLEAAHHHLMLSYCYTLAFEKEKSFVHAQSAHDLFTDAGSVWGLMRTDEIMGTAYYTAWMYEEAHTCYARLEERIAQIGNEAAPMRPFYGRGWVYLGQKNFTAALDCFQLGQALKQQTALHYDVARCQYAEGYTRFRQKDYQGARICHETALATFCNNDHFTLNLHNFGQGSRSVAMMAACLHNLALISEYRRRFRDAFAFELRAVTRQRELHDPGQMSDFLRRGIYLSGRCGRLDYTVKLALEYLQLRRRYKVP